MRVVTEVILIRPCESTKKNLNKQIPFSTLFVGWIGFRIVSKIHFGAPVSPSADIDCSSYQKLYCEYIKLVLLNGATG